MKKKIVTTIKQFYEYLLLIEPDEATRQEVAAIKRDFYNKYKAPAAINGKPHITLVNFIMQAGENEGEVIRRLKTIAAATHYIKIWLEDFKSFGSHTIYIDVIDKFHTKALVNRINKQAGQLMSAIKELPAHFSKESHLTISRQLTAQQYENAAPEYRQKKFSNKFIANGMLLLKRPVEETKYQVVERFEFGEKNFLHSVIQGRLFKTD